MEPAQEALERALEGIDTCSQISLTGICPTAIEGDLIGQLKWLTGGNNISAVNEGQGVIATIHMPTTNRWTGTMLADFKAWLRRSPDCEITLT